MNHFLYLSSYWCKMLIEKLVYTIIFIGVFFKDLASSPFSLNFCAQVWCAIIRSNNYCFTEYVWMSLQIYFWSFGRRLAYLFPLFPFCRLRRLPPPPCLRLLRFCFQWLLVVYVVVVRLCTFFCFFWICSVGPFLFCRPIYFCVYILGLFVFFLFFEPVTVYWASYVVLATDFDR